MVLTGSQLPIGWHSAAGAQRCVHPLFWPIQFLNRLQGSSALRRDGFVRLPVSGDNQLSFFFIFKVRQRARRQSAPRLGKHTREPTLLCPTGRYRSESRGLCRSSGAIGFPLSYPPAAARNRELSNRRSRSGEQLVFHRASLL